MCFYSKYYFLTEKCTVCSATQLPAPMMFLHNLYNPCNPGGAGRDRRVRGREGGENRAGKEQKHGGKYRKQVRMEGKEETTQKEGWK